MSFVGVAVMQRRGRKDCELELRGSPSATCTCIDTYLEICTVPAEPGFIACDRSQLSAKLQKRQQTPTL